MRTLGVIGAAIFATFFSLTYSVPGWVEEFAAEYIESEVAKNIDATIDTIRPPESEGTLARIAQTMYERNEARIEQGKENLRHKVHEQWASALALVRNLDCECRQKYADIFESGFKTDIALLQAANDRIVDFIQASYMDVATEVKKEIRIFTASNAVVFILLLLVSYLKPQAITHLFLPGILLAISTLVCSYFYIFEQNWLLTIIHSDYLGFAYLTWLGVVFLSLCDVLLNRARITTTIFNTIASVVGSAISVVPC